MLLPSEENEIEPFTWFKLKEFCNSLSEDQLLQEVIVPQEDGYVKISYASELGEDQYNFTEEEYTCTKDSFDPQMFDVPTMFEEALIRFDYSITPGTNVYLFDE